MMFQSWLQELSNYNLASLFIFFLIENLILLLIAVAIGKIIEYEHTKMNHTDLKWVLSTVICNSVITLFGYELFRYGIITIEFVPSIPSVIFDTLLLIVVMDFSMFCFHYLVHQIKWLYPVHKLHHTHVETNIYSLFVLHPIETLGFGSIWLLLISFIDFNYISIIFYLILNLLYGVFGHLKKDVFPEFWYKNYFTRWISTTKFHSNHHKNESHNYGFYFTIWDKIFRTNLQI